MHKPRVYEENLGFLKTRIGRRILVILLLISLLPLIVMSWFALGTSEDSIRQQTRFGLKACVSAGEAQLREFLLQMKEATVGFSADPRVIGLLAQARDGRLSPEEQSELSELAKIRDNSSLDVTELFVVALDGVVVGSSDQSRVGVNVSETEIFQSAKREFQFGDVVPEGDAITWVMAGPVKVTNTGKVIGVVGCRISPVTLSDLTTGRRVLRQGARLQTLRIGDTGETYLVNRKHQIITETRAFSNAVLNVKAETYPVIAGLKDGKEVNDVYEDYRGVVVSGASVTIPETGWVLVTEIDFTQTFAPIRELRNGLAILASALGMVVIVLAWSWTKRLMRPLAIMAHGDRALAEGNEASAIVPEDNMPNNELGDFVRIRNQRFKTLFEKQRQLNLEQRRRIEAATELEQMSYSIVHDMRAPLRAITNFATILHDELANDVAPEYQEYLRRMVAAASRMDRLITDMLSYSRLTREPLPMSAVDVTRLLHEMIKTYPMFHPFEGNIKIDPDIPKVRANDAALSQCFARMLENAIKFSKPGQPVQVEITAEVSDRRVRIWVQDNGIGMPLNLQEKVFGIFQQGAVCETSTGIGLALVRTAVTRMGGRVGVESQPEAGSRFWIELEQALEPGYRPIAATA